MFCKRGVGWWVLDSDLCGAFFHVELYEAVLHCPVLFYGIGRWRPQLPSSTMFSIYYYFFVFVLYVKLGGLSNLKCYLFHAFWQYEDVLSCIVVWNWEVAAPITIKFKISLFVLYVKLYEAWPTSDVCYYQTALHRATEKYIATESYRSL